MIAQKKFQKNSVLRLRIMVSLLMFLFLFSCGTPQMGVSPTPNGIARENLPGTTAPPLLIGPPATTGAPVITGAITPLVPIGPTPAMPAGLEKIEHFVFIMQENRSFDHYFGTYPGAEGIPPGIALRDPTDGVMVSPYHLQSDIAFDAPHNWENSVADINGGKMDGFMEQAYVKYPLSVTPVPGKPAYDPKEIMGYYDFRDIPNYWNYADLYILQDHMFASVASYSLPVHLYMLAAQSGGFVGNNQVAPISFNFPEITLLLQSGKINWKYYVTAGNETDERGVAIEPEELRTSAPKRYTLWNPLPAFPAVKNDPNQMTRLVDTAEFYEDAASGNLPQVSWICPLLGSELSEHPAFRGGGVRDGMAYVTGLINAVMQGPQWETTAIFLAWDDWGGYYDHVAPPVVDELGYGIRVPGLVISPYGKQGYIDKKTYSFDSWLKIVEERFGVTSMTGRDQAAFDMIDAFDFNQKPRPPVVLSATKEGSPYPPPKQIIER